MRAELIAVALAAGAVAGCAGARGDAGSSAGPPPPPPPPSASASAPAPVPAAVPVDILRVEADPFTDQPRLSGEAVLRVALERSPLVQARREAWRAALARRPQATTWDQPMASYRVAPKSIGRGSEPAHEIMLSQTAPWPGRRGDAGDAAQARARAAYAMSGDEERERVVEARALFADYWLAHRRSALLDDARRLAAALGEAARARAGATASTMEALDAAMALAETERRLLEAARQRRSAQAALNAMLARDVDAALPPPVEELPAAHDLADYAFYKGLANQQPRVVAAEAELRAAEAELHAAGRAGWPDVRVFGAYTTMEDDRTMDVQVGVEVALPLWRNALDAGEAERRAARAERRADLAAALARSERELADAFARVHEQIDAVRLAQATTLPAATQAAAAARAAYAGGDGTLAQALQAERALIAARLMEAEEQAELYRQLGNLECCIGIGVIAGSPVPARPQPRKASP